MNCRTPRTWRSGQRRLPVDVRVAARLEQAVALAQRNVERLGQRQQRLPARLRAAGLDEADVAAGEPGAERQIELAHAAGGAPVAKQLSDGGGGHASHATQTRAARPLPPG
jgi:hypothetical protein